MPETLESVLVGLIVLGAFVYLVGHFTGAFERLRRRRRPDVPVSGLVRRKKNAPDRRDP